jgi:3-deoxy-D-manno-octulosonic acid kinase
MFKNVSVPSSFSFVKKGKTFLLINEEYKDLLLQQGIEDLETFLKRNRRDTQYLNGRIPHPSIPIKDGERVVLRQYSHGGLLRAFTRNLYLFGSRSFQELSLTEEIRSSGIPTIQPIGAIHQLTVFPFYHAYLLSLEITHAINLIQYLKEISSYPLRETLLLKRKTIRSISLLLRKFHGEGFFHGDLQLKNILIAKDQVLLIDFDRSYRKPILSTRERMKNLLRLNRSVEKWRGLGLPITRTDCWRFFLTYAGEDQKIRETMKKALRTYPIRSFFYRWCWALEKILGS